MGREQQQEEQKQQNTRVPDFSSPNFVVTKSRCGQMSWWWRKVVVTKSRGDEKSLGRRVVRTKSRLVKCRVAKRRLVRKVR